MRFLTELLVGQGYEVVQAWNGVAAMVSLTAPEPASPQVVLLGLGLPLENGLSVLSFLRKVMRSRLPVVVLSAGSEAGEEAAVQELGVSGWLRKPASAQQVLAALSSALG